MKSNILLGIVISMFMFVGCIDTKLKSQAPESASGVIKVEAKVRVQSNGLTIEQSNIKKRLENENAPGAIKHLYVISAMSGQTIIYSTVKGKITSSGKRLTPYLVAAMDGQYVSNDLNGIPIRIGGRSHRTGEILQDDGTYGSSIPYLYWWDVKGQYHQHYVSGGQIIHVADKPIPVKNITINMESAGTP